MNDPLLNIYMQLFGTLVNGNNPLTILVKMSVTIVWETFKYAILKATKRPSYYFNACCPLKGHIYFKQTCRFDTTR